MVAIFSATSYSRSWLMLHPLRALPAFAAQGQMRGCPSAPPGPQAAARLPEELTIGEP